MYTNGILIGKVAKKKNIFSENLYQSFTVNSGNPYFMSEFEIYQNIPFVDTTGLTAKKLFFFQRAGRRIWIEIPFLGITFRLRRN